MEDEKSYCHFQSPVGWIQIVGTPSSIEAVIYCDEMPEHQSLFVPKTLQHCQQQLEAYFQGELQEFDLPLSPKGTDFQQRVWKELVQIPLGRTSTYLRVSQQLGDRKAIRAVGTANGRNPISIIVPCHRVIGSDGSLTGYAGGLWRKRWLLEHEQKMIGADRQLSLF